MIKYFVNLLININIEVVSFTLGIFDKIYQKKIIKQFKKIFNSEIDSIFDVGSHRGEFINLILKNFTIKNIQAFEPSLINFNYLKNKIKKKNIFLNNYALGEKKEIKKFKQMKESSSSTFSEINVDTKYFKRKNFILNLGLDTEIFEEVSIKIDTGLNLLEEKKIISVDLLKIDTEGHEYFVIKGFGKEIHKIKVIFFEHHYDQMIVKKYTFSDIHKYLKNNGFEKHSKFKMPFRKSFEYIYVNRDYF